MWDRTTNSSLFQFSLLDINCYDSQRPHWKKSLDRIRAPAPHRPPPQLVPWLCLWLRSSLVELWLRWTSTGAPASCHFLTAPPSDRSPFKSLPKCVQGDKKSQSADLDIQLSALESLVSAHGLHQVIARWQKSPKLTFNTSEMVCFRKWQGSTPSRCVQVLGEILCF